MNTIDTSKYTKINWPANPVLLTEKISEILYSAWSYALANKITNQVSSELTPEKIALYLQIFTDGRSLNSTWAQAFTHQTVDYDKNYETLEFTGDTIISTVFVEYLYYIFGGKIDKASGTLMKNKYLSKPDMSVIARHFHLDDYMVVNRQDFRNTNMSIQEDVFESFFGAVNKIGNERLGFGEGFKHCFYLIAYVMKDINILQDKAAKEGRSTLKELFEKMGYGKVGYTTTFSDNISLGKKKTSVVIIPQNRVLAIAYGNGVKESEEAAATAALKQLAREGITTETADQMKMDKEAQMYPQFAKQRQRLEQAIQISNAKRYQQNLPPITLFHFLRAPINTTKGTRDTIILQVAYKDKDGNPVWSTIQQEDTYDPIQGKISLARKFADSQGVPP